MSDNKSQLHHVTVCYNFLSVSSYDSFTSALQSLERYSGCFTCVRHIVCIIYGYTRKNLFKKWVYQNLLHSSTSSSYLTLLFLYLAYTSNLPFDITMATSLVELEEQLKCPVCLELYTDPKILPCHHSFCQECLEKLSKKKEASGDTYYLSCPTCRQCTKVPREGVGAFPVAFHLNNLNTVKTEKLNSP